MKNYFLLLLLVLLSFGTKANAEKLDPMFFTCPDIIYYEGELYSANNSFLKAYEKHKDLFNEEGRPRYTKKQPYVLLWIVENDKLYVCGLDQYHINDSVEQSLTEIETLTKHKMPLVTLSYKELNNIPGYMKCYLPNAYFANMVSGTFYIKKDMRKDENMKDWINESFLEIKIKDGVIKSVSDWENMRDPVKSKSSERK